MARFQVFECPDCLGRFRVLLHPNDAPPPDACPLCNADMTAEPVFVPQAPAVARTIGKSADQVYRDLETASQHRAEAAAELTGQDVGDFAALKITNMRDSLRPGDVAAKIPNNPVSQFMQQTGQGGFQAAPSGADFARGTTQGPVPRAGEGTRLNVISGHRDRMRVVESRDMIAKSK